MFSRKVLAVIGAISAAAIVTGTAIAMAANDPAPAPPASTVSDDGTADQGRGDVATETPRPGDDDGTPDQGPGDVPAEAGEDGGHGGDSGGRNSDSGPGGDDGGHGSDDGGHGGSGSSGEGGAED
jgi:hypothetical protein